MKNYILLAALSLLLNGISNAQSGIAVSESADVNKTSDQNFQYDSTRQLIALVKDAAELVKLKGEAAFNTFRLNGSSWRKGENYIFVLDQKGNMLVHPDSDLEGHNKLDLKDINGRPIIQGLIEAASSKSDKLGGWFHYEWPVPGGILPRWKSSFVMLVKSPSGKRYIIGSGMYNDRMERDFVVDVVKDAVAQIELNADAAFKRFRDQNGPFRIKDAYVFVIDSIGTELVNPPFPNLEGRNLMNLKDINGKLLVKEMFNVVNKSGSGWLDYMWPKPGESISTQKSTYITKAKIGNKWVLVGCGVYLANAPKSTKSNTKMNATDLIKLVHEATILLEQQGEKAYPELRKKGSKWFHDDIYFFVWTIDGVREFHAANPESEGLLVSELKDVLGRPIGKMIMDAAANTNGEGWLHYMYPEPGNIFPAWKSTFAKRVTFPSGKDYIVGCGIYGMQMDKAFIEDLVNRAGDLVAANGKDAFAQLRDKTGPYLFMDTYVFVQTPDGMELVNSAQPSFEGKNLMGLKDLNGKLVIKEQNEIVMKKGSAWLKFQWYKPGDNTPAMKYSYVKKVIHEGEVYIVGSGYYQ